METNAILGPVATLALWSMVMWVWMYATRIPAMNRAKIDAKNLVGTTGRGLAWAYVVLRIAHSLWQATVNRIPVRLALFALSSLCLIALSLLAVIATLG